MPPSAIFQLYHGDSISGGRSRSTQREPPTMASNWKTLSLAAASRVHPFCNLQIQALTYSVLEIGLYELLGNPTTYLIEPPGPPDSLSHPGPDLIRGELLY